MIKKREFAFFVLLIVHLTVNAQKMKRIDFATPESIESNRRISFCIDVPKGYVDIKKQGDTHPGLEVKVVHYADSSMIYIGNNIDEGSILNWQNKVSGGYVPLKKKSALDTLSMNGTQSNGKFWKEEIVGRVVVGYVNAAPERKSMFDKALTTLKQKRKR